MLYVHVLIYFILSKHAVIWYNSLVTHAPIAQGDRAPVSGPGAQVRILLGAPIANGFSNFREAVFVCYYLYLLHWIPLDLNSFMSMSIDLSIISSLDIYTIFL